MTGRISRLAVRSIFVLGVALLAGELFACYYSGFGTPPLLVKHPTIEYPYQSNQDVHRFGNRFLITAYGMRSEPFPPHNHPLVDEIPAHGHQAVIIVR